MREMREMREMIGFSPPQKDGASIGLARDHLGMESNDLPERWNGTNDTLTERIIGAAIEVQKRTGPGLLELTYEDCLDLELTLSGMSFERQVLMPIVYRSRQILRAYRTDLIVENLVIVEIKAVEKLLPVHDAQVMTYLRMSGIGTGLIINFNAVPLTKGIRRLTNSFTSFPSSSPSPEDTTGPDTRISDAG
jgi:GxxExxY protein